MELFYASGLWYERGDLIQPGSWGRVVRGMGTAHTWFATEMFVEHVRQVEFPRSASRMHSLMASDCVETARQWLDSTRFHIYKIEVTTDPTVADVGWLNRVTVNHTVHGAVRAHSLVDVLDCIRSYWSGHKCPDGSPMEYLVPGPGRVAERLS